MRLEYFDFIAKSSSDGISRSITVSLLFYSNSNFEFTRCYFSESNLFYISFQFIRPLDIHGGKVNDNLPRAPK